MRATGPMFETEDLAVFLCDQDARRPFGGRSTDSREAHRCQLSAIVELQEDLRAIKEAAGAETTPVAAEISYLPRREAVRSEVLEPEIIPPECAMAQSIARTLVSEIRNGLKFLAAGDIAEAVSCAVDVDFLLRASPVYPFAHLGAQGEDEHRKARRLLDVCGALTEPHEATLTVRGLSEGRVQIEAELKVPGAIQLKDDLAALVPPEALLLSYELAAEWSQGSRRSPVSRYSLTETAKLEFDFDVPPQLMWFMLYVFCGPEMLGDWRVVRAVGEGDNEWRLEQRK